MAYTIQINEYQRALLVKKLLHPNTVMSTETGTGDEGAGSSDTELEEYNILLSMLVELPKAEQENPGNLHGFCL